MDETPQSGQEEVPSRVVLQELEVGLMGIAGELGGQSGQPKPKALGLGPTPGTEEGGGAKRMKHLVGKDAEAPQEGVAVEAIGGGASQAELAQFAYALLDEGSLAIAAPCGEGWAYPVSVDR